MIDKELRCYYLSFKVELTVNMKFDDSEVTSFYKLRLAQSVHSVHNQARYILK